MTWFWLLTLASSAAPTRPPVDAGVELTTFRTPADAFEALLAGPGPSPVILAVGEYHELSDGPKAPSALKHFSDELLPRLKGRMTSLIVETWVTTGRCGRVEKQATAQVEKTTKRPESTEDELTTMMGRAYDLGGVTNHVLSVKCTDYEALLDADGTLDADRALLLVKEKLQEKTQDVRDREEGGVEGKLLVLYGGAIHNDLAPTPDEAKYAFGPALSQAVNDVGGGYLELDLLVPEFVANDAELKAEPWFSKALQFASVGKTVLIRKTAHSAAIVFSKKNAAQLKKR